MMMIGATFLLPAVLSLLGRRAFAVRMPWARKPKAHNPAGSGFARYGRWLQHHFRWSVVSPWPSWSSSRCRSASMRLGFTDDGGRPEGSSARIAYDLLAEGFGPGLNGPFIVTARDRARPVTTPPSRQLAGALERRSGGGRGDPVPDGAGLDR